MPHAVIMTVERTVQRHIYRILVTGTTDTPEFRARTARLVSEPAGD